MQSLGRTARRSASVYFTGGATVVLLGWRQSTIDVDILLVPEDDALLRALPHLKEELEINVELASPAHFIPELAGWQARSPFIGREGALSFFHYDPTAQALAKIERGHVQDLADAREMLRRGLIQEDELRRRFAEIEPRLYRYPAIDPAAFHRALEAFLAEESATGP